MTKHLILILILLNSCNGKNKFNKVRWMEREGMYTFPNRKFILDDLINNYHLKGKSYKEIIDLLGRPSPALELDSNFNMVFEVDIEFGKNNEMVHVKSLSLIFNRDSIVRDFKINDWKKEN